MGSYWYVWKFIAFWVGSVKILPRSAEAVKKVFVLIGGGLCWKSLAFHSVVAPGVDATINVFP